MAKYWGASYTRECLIHETARCLVGCRRAITSVQPDTLSKETQCLVIQVKLGVAKHSSRLQSFTKASQVGPEAWRPRCLDTSGSILFWVGNHQSSKRPMSEKSCLVISLHGVLCFVSKVNQVCWQNSDTSFCFSHLLSRWPKQTVVLSF